MLELEIFSHLGVLVLSLLPAVKKADFYYAKIRISGLLGNLEADQT